MKVLTKLDKGIQVVYDYIMMATGCAVAGLIIVSAFLRYILKIDFYGSEEYILLAGFWLYFTGSMSAARDKSHIPRHWQPGPRRRAPWWWQWPS